MIVCIEGTDAAGKATQSKRFAARTGATLFSFPTYDNHPDALAGPVIADHLHGFWRADRVTREQVPSAKKLPLDAFVFQCVMLANKYEMADKIANAAMVGSVVLDRYWPSGLVYGVEDGLDRGWLLRTSTALPQPEVFILLDVSYETALERRPERRDRYESKGKDFYDRIRSGYLDLWRAAAGVCLTAGDKRTPDLFGSSWVIVNGEQTVERVAADVQHAVQKHLDTIG